MEFYLALIIKFPGATISGLIIPRFIRPFDENQAIEILEAFYPLILSYFMEQSTVLQTILFKSSFVKSVILMGRYSSIPSVPSLGMFIIIAGIEYLLN